MWSWISCWTNNRVVHDLERHDAHNDAKSENTPPNSSRTLRHGAYFFQSSIRATFHHSPWWRHQMETFSALLVLCAGNSPVTGEFPAQRPVTRSFDVFFDLRLNKRLSKQSWGWWFETPSRSLWRHCNALSCRTQYGVILNKFHASHVSLIIICSNITLYTEDDYHCGHMDEIFVNAKDVVSFYNSDGFCYLRQKSIVAVSLLVCPRGRTPKPWTGRVTCLCVWRLIKDVNKRQTCRWNKNLNSILFTLKRKCHFDDIFITGWTGSCHSDHF